MTSEPTLEDLYQALDWSGSDESLEAWKKEHPEVEETQESGFARNWRLTLLLYALPKEITGDQAEDWSEEKQESARGALHHAGVWPQVCDWLIQNDLIDVSAVVEDIAKKSLIQKGKDWIRSQKLDR
mgnify:CR=1 FL=1